MNAIDPLADTVPPRHAYESDDEDEYDPTAAPASEPRTLDIQIAGLAKKGSALIVASGEGATAWARGAQLGEQTGAVFVNKVQVGMLFSPSWAKISVLISEVTTRLPTWAMHKYADAVLAELAPSRLSLLDEYSTHAYISQEPILPQDAPIRYLFVNTPAPNQPGNLQLLSPPNLIQSTSASFLSLAALTSATPNEALPATLVLLPSQHIAPPAPVELLPSNFAGVFEDDHPWSTLALQTATDTLLAGTGENATLRWEGKGKSATSGPSAKRRGDVGDGGMYV